MPVINFRFKIGQITICDFFESAQTLWLSILTVHSYFIFIIILFATVTKYRFTDVTWIIKVLGHVQNFWYTGPNWGPYNYIGIRFLVATEPFLANMDKILHGKSGYHYLSIVHEELKFWLRCFLPIGSTFWVNFYLEIATLKKFEPEPHRSIISIISSIIRRLIKIIDKTRSSTRL